MNQLQDQGAAKAADPQNDPTRHPLYPVLMDAIRQAMHGKGQRHGGASVPWLTQPIFHYAKMHGRGFLTGQAAKKLEEAAHTRSDEPFITEMLGAIVYAGAAIVAERQKMEREKADAVRAENMQMIRERPSRRDVVFEQKVQGHDGPGGLVGAMGAGTEMAATHSEADRLWRNLDPAAWARMEEKVMHRAVDETSGFIDRRSKHHNKLTAPDAGVHPRKGMGRSDCENCMTSICDLCRRDIPKRRATDAAPAPAQENDERVFRVGRCTCGTSGDSDTHHITCGALSIDPLASR